MKKLLKSFLLRLWAIGLYPLTKKNPSKEYISYPIEPDIQPEEVVFDKAEHAELLEEKKEEYKSKIKELESNMTKTAASQKRY